MLGIDKKRIVVVGGGTGTHTVLTGLKQYRKSADLTAIVAVTDSGGSTGRLRDEFGYLPVGDVRMALAALAKEDDEHEMLIRKLFLHRFASNGDVAGHNFGNLFLVALTDILGSEEVAIEAASRVLQVCGRVLPVTHTKVNLVAHYADGREVVGEHEIDEPNVMETHVPITALRVTPNAILNPSVQETLHHADVIVFGPGDLYTSILANCVIEGFQEAIQESNATLVYIANLMTKVGQTTGMGVREHVDELARYIGRSPDVILVNDTPLPEELLIRYAREREFPVLMNLDTNVLKQDLLATEEIIRSPGDVLKRSLIRHDPHKLAQVLMAICSSK